MEATARTPPAMGKSPIREVLGFLQARGQFGFPPSMHLDACLGYCCVGYQGAEMALSKCDAGKYILVRLGGAVSKGCDAAKSNLAQKAKVGYCPCCTKATQIAIPMSYHLGE